MSNMRKGLLLITPIMMLLGTISGCQSSNNSTESGKCTFSSGTYQYGLHMNLLHDPATFADGTEEKSFWGSTYITVDGNGFSFRGGEQNAWEVEGTCLNGWNHPVKITLHNACGSDYLTTASSMMIDTSKDKTENGLHVIEAYFIQWTCGGDAEMIAQERWDLFLR